MTEHDNEYDPEPDSPEFLAVEAFLEALAIGEESAAAKALRKLASLGGALQGAALETLAERFEGDSDPYYPWVLRLQRTKKGAPPGDHLRAEARQFTIAMCVKEALAKPNTNLEAAFYDVHKQIGVSKSTVKNAYYAMKKSSSSK